MFRHEQKYIIKQYQYAELRTVLGSMMEHDEHAGDEGEYMIRSLYFDDMYMSAYHDKLDGVYRRKKYRVRVYDCRDTVINLECKLKEGAYIDKKSVRLARAEYDCLIADDWDFLLRKGDILAEKFYIDGRTALLRPQVIVDYEREPYVFEAGTVRITFDKNVRACAVPNDIFDRHIPGYHILPTDEMILEIKFTGYLPERIRRIFKVRNFTQTSASKYCMCVDRVRGIY